MEDPLACRGHSTDRIDLAGTPDTACMSERFITQEKFIHSSAAAMMMK